MNDAATTFRWRRAWLVKAITGSALIAAGAAAMGTAIATRGFGDFAVDRRIILTMLFLAFGIVLAGAAASYLGELLRPRPIVRMGADGLEDRRISARPIPWRDIQGVLLIQNGMQLMLALDVADPSRAPPPRNPVWRLNRWCARRLGRPELMVRVTGLDADLFTVVESINAYRAAV